MTPPAWFNALLPPATHRGLLRRGAIVWAVALVIGMLNYFNLQANKTLDAAMVYSFSISTSIWLLIDPMRIVLRRWLNISAPHYWSFSPRASLWMALSMVMGYALGSAIGDGYTGTSSLSFLADSPKRFWSFLLTSMAISFGFLFFFYQREKALVLQQQATEARLRLLETQLEPHMLFNTLANLRALIAVDPNKAIHMLDRLNGYLRATLRASRSGELNQRPHTLQDEFDRLSDYLEIMAIRMGTRLRYSLALPPELAAHRLPALLLQPLVENAIRHGLEPHVDGGEITVQARTEGQQLVLTVVDSGIGCEGDPSASEGAKEGTSEGTSKGSSESGSGFGLAQVRERLHTAFGPAPKGVHRLQWHSAPHQGTRISLRLPLNPTPQA